MSTLRRPNRLIREKSPYLRQHAHNPVDWYPWGEEAFGRASREDKPIFLSVGYSTCHWCHVMEHESFENETVAALLNEHFVSIKVDREERPDVDRIYMSSLQAMGQAGGWPMSMFLTPDLKPFYGGTYYPPETKYGRTGFTDILTRIHEVWTAEREKVLEASGRVTGFLHDMARTQPAAAGLDDSLFSQCAESLEKSFDRVFGGFGMGPKFPRPSVFNFLLRYHYRSGRTMALEMTETSLQRMSSGGMFDHIGGGFHRYAVDTEWRVPHFEKMLYDQAQLLSTLVDAYLVTSNPYYAAVGRETADYVLRDLRSPDGGFYSAEDADSPRAEDPAEAGEGAYYVWTKREIQEILGDQAEVFCYHYGVTEEGNVPFDPQQEFTGRNIVYVAHSLSETARYFSRDLDSVRHGLAASKRALGAARSRRPRPGLDDKILTGWNGLMIGALARAAGPLRRREYLAAATEAAGTLRRLLYSASTGRLRRRYREMDASIDGMLEDYALLVQGLIDLSEASSDPEWLRWAMDLTAKQIELFWDSEGGGFYATTGDDPSILVRIKELYDGAEPSGNSVAAMNLLRLSEVMQREEWRSMAERTLTSSSGLLSSQPTAMPNMLCALDFLLSRPVQIVVAGGQEATQNEAMLDAVRDVYAPGRILLSLDDATRPLLESLAPWLSAYHSVEGKPAAYICRDYACQLPVLERERVAEAIKGP